MSAFVQGKGAVFINGYDISGQVTKVNLDLECDIQEKTSYDSSGSREYMPGLLGGKLSVEGFMHANMSDAFEKSLINNTSGICTIFPRAYTTDATEGIIMSGSNAKSNEAYGFLIDGAKLTRTGEIGQLYGFNYESAVEGIPFKSILTGKVIANSTSYYIAYVNATDMISLGSRYAILHHQLTANANLNNSFQVSCSSSFTVFTDYPYSWSSTASNVTTFMTRKLDNTASTDRPYVRFVIYSSSDHSGSYFVGVY